MNPVERLLLDPEPLTPELLALPDLDALKTRLKAYLRLAGYTPEAELTEAQRQHVLALIYGARIVVLEEKVEEFEAVGEVKVKQAVMARVARLTVQRDAALAAMKVVPVEQAQAGGLGFAPILSAWGVEP